jgi:hypothetical protein
MNQGTRWVLLMQNNHHRKSHAWAYRKKFTGFLLWNITRQRKGLVSRAKNKCLIGLKSVLKKIWIKAVRRSVAGTALTWTRSVRVQGNVYLEFTGLSTSTKVSLVHSEYWRHCPFNIWSNLITRLLLFAYSLFDISFGFVYVVKL